MKAHPASEVFPLFGDSELRELAEDIQRNGLKHPIVTYHGEVLDGRNRLRACTMAAVVPRFEAYTGDDPVGHVVSMNLKRRHLDESQRAMVGARIKGMYEAEAKERMREGARAAGAGKATANLPEPSRGESREKAASAVNVSPRSVESATRVIEAGAPTLIAAVDSGQIAVSAAAKLTHLPKEKQEEIVAKVSAGDLKAQHAVSEMRREERIDKLAEIAQGNTPLTAPAERFPVLYADPPWRYEHAETESRAIENQYPTMTLDDICALPVADVLTPDAILFLWVTSPKLEEGMRVVREWGFTYRTCMVWDKEKIGMGYYARQQHELLLICTRGNPPPPAARHASSIGVPRGSRRALGEAHLVLRDDRAHVPDAAQARDVLPRAPSRLDRLGQPVEGSVIHSFRQDLAASHKCEDLPFWDGLYRQAFPELVEVRSTRNDRAKQRLGIDRIFVLGNGKTLDVDEKCRFTDYGDFALEVAHEWLSEDRVVGSRWRLPDVEPDPASRRAA